MATDEQKAVRQQSFRFTCLPHELQCSILSSALDAGTSAATLLCISSHLYPHVQYLLYRQIQIPSLQHLHRFLETASHKYAKIHARSFTFSVPGVPGGSTRGGRESAQSSPDRQSPKAKRVDDRLMLASRAIQLCPNLRHCSIQMFGVRHSSLLTSNDYIAEETNAFRIAISQLKYLQTLSWITPKENVNFVGFSVAVVDLAFEPLVEGLEEAALDISVDGHRVSRIKGDPQRYHHPLQQITLHHCIFPSNQGKQFFQLFTKSHPDDEDFLLFPRLELICIRKATNISPVNVAFLALFWQLNIDKDSESKCLPVDWDPQIVLEDVFTSSIWGPRLSSDLVMQNMELLIESSLSRNNDKMTSSSNAYIRALEESVELQVKLNEEMGEQVRTMKQWQRDKLVSKACNRIRVEFVRGAIASYQ